MTRPYSLDLRKRVVEAVSSGQSCRAVAKRFNVSVASVVKWSQRFRATGSAAAKPMGGNRPIALGEEERVFLLARMGADPNVTLRGLQAELAKRGVRVCYGTVWKFVHAQGLSFKKNRIRKRAEPT